MNDSHIGNTNKYIYIFIMQYNNDKKSNEIMCEITY